MVIKYGIYFLIIANINGTRKDRFTLLGKHIKKKNVFAQSKKINGTKGLIIEAIGAKKKEIRKLLSTPNMLDG